MNTTVKKYQIAPEVLNVLGNAQTHRNTLTIHQQLDRKLYVEVNKVLEALGGKWDRKARAHVFDGDAAELVDEAVLTGSYSRTKQDFGQFYTPALLAKLVVKCADVHRGMLVLEPSAGYGALAVEARDQGATVDTFDIDPASVRVLQAAGFDNARQRDFLKMDPVEIYDRVIMNPPFAKRADIFHIDHAMKFLKPGGKLVSIASASVAFRDDALAHTFREMVRINGGSIEPLPEGSFKSAGTMVNTVLVQMEKRA